MQNLFFRVILFPVGITDVFEQDFQQKKNFPNFVAFDLLKGKLWLEVFAESPSDL